MKTLRRFRLSFGILVSRSEHAPGIRESKHRQCHPLASLIVAMFVLSLPSKGFSDIWINATESGGNTVISISGTAATFAGLPTVIDAPTPPTRIWPANGQFYFTGPTGGTGGFDRSVEIPGFTFGTGPLNESPTALAASNPFILFIGMGISRVVLDDDNPLPDNFSGSATYSGTIADNGIDTTPQTLTLGNGQRIFLFVPPVVRITGPRQSYRYRNRLTVRGTSDAPLSALQVKWSGRSGFKTIQLNGATSWRAKVPRNILRTRRAVTVRVRGIDEVANLSSVVKRRYRRIPGAI